MPKPVDCDSDEAAYRVLAIEENDSAEIDCIDVKGATSIMSFMHGDVSGYCLAGIDEDVDRNINDIKAGECVALEGDTALRQDCGAPGALKVLALDPEPKLVEPGLPGFGPSTCEKLGAPEATQYYKWGLPENGFSSMPNYKRGMCLAPAS